MTPIRRQYLKIKGDHPDAILLFRMGDFYETFYDDAVLAAKELEITLTSRSMGKGLRVPLAGVPAHSLDNYLFRLIKKATKLQFANRYPTRPPPRDWSTVRWFASLLRARSSSPTYSIKRPTTIWRPSPSEAGGLD